MSYKYGTYGHLADSVVSATDVSSTAAVYIGTAPVNLVRGFQDAGVVNSPIRIDSYTDAKEKIGISPDWATFSLCEAVEAHFNNGKGNVGPIYVINVLNPTTDRAATQTTKSLTFVNGKASFASDKIILDTFALADKAEGTDYNLAYNFLTGKVMITSADENNLLTGTLAASYYEVDASGIDIDTIIGVATDAGVYTGIQAANLIYQKYNVIPNIFAAPGWSQYPDVYKALIQIATKLNGHWDGFVYADIPLSYVKPTSYTPVSDPNPGDNPSTSSWYEYDETNHVYAVSEDTQVNTSKIYYTVAETAAEPEPSDNPSSKGWYEKSGTTYTLSADTEVDAGKTYYVITPSAVTNVNPGDNPRSEGWYELNGVTYTASTDTQVNVDKTYYEAGSSETEKNDTIAKANDWKTNNGYTSERSKVFWPKALGTDDKVYCVSTLAVVETLRVDNSHSGVPFETCGNKTVSVKKQFFGEDSANQGFDIEKGNQLCANGVSTIIFWSGAWRLWGDSTAAYVYGDESVDLRDYFDVTMRMLLHLTNRFQRVWFTTIDKPFTISVRDTILVREQQYLDSLVATGALIGKPTITFDEVLNTMAEVRAGNFYFNIAVTPTPPFHSATAYVAYTDEGFSAYFE